MTNRKPYRSPTVKCFALSLVWFWALILPISAEASEPWESDPIGTQAYNAYQDVDAAYDFTMFLSDVVSYAWGESYFEMGFLSMYEGTKDTAYLDRLVDQFDVVLSNRADNLGIVDEVRGYIMPAWSTTKSTDGLEHCWGVHAGMITHPAARFAYLVKSTPSLQPQYLAKALEYETAIRETVDAFDVDVRIGPGADECYYLSGASGLVVAYNKQNALGRTFVDLWLSTGEAKYLDKATRLANFFKNDLTAVGNRYVWPYHVTSGGAEDISHAAINVDFAFQCYRAGIVFDEADMQAFTETLKYISLGPEDGFTTRVNGEMTKYDYSYRTGVWSHLGYLDEEVREMVFDYFDYYDPEYCDERWIPFRNHGALAASYLVETSRDFAFNAPLLMAGDANGDGCVDDIDASILAASWQTASGATWEMGDFNNDGTVNDADASILATNWQRGVLTMASVPEPATLLLSFIAVAWLLSLRYRRGAKMITNSKLYLNFRSFPDGF